MRALVLIGIAAAFVGLGACSSFEADAPAVQPTGDGGAEGASIVPAVDGGAGPSEIVALYAGNSNGCVLRRDHRLACWGKNESGQVGAVAGGNDTCGSVPCRTSAVEVTGAGDVVQLSIGEKSMCALRADGTIACWGSNDDDRLGSSGESGPAPRVVPGLPGKALEVAVGSDAACARVDHAGTTEVWCWGGTRHGITGQPPTPYQSDALGPPAPPARLDGLDGAAEIALGPTLPSLACARMADGTVKCWGMNYKGGAGVDPSGMVVCANFFGTDFACTEKRVPIANLHAEHIAVGWGFACGLSAGVVSCWGDNEHGIFAGAPDDKVHVAPTVVSVEPLTSITVGENHVCGLTGGGEVYCWGGNTSGEQGTILTSGGCAGAVLYSQSCNPTPVSPSAIELRNVTKLAAGSYFTAALVGGKVYAWGLNQDGRSGHPPGTKGDQPSPCGIALTACSAKPVEIAMPW